MAYTTINKSTDYFNTKLYTGTGSSNALTGVGFQPDWVWLKKRNSSAHHQLFDAVRGVTKRIYSSTNGAESTDAQTLTAFGTDGFTLGTNSYINGNSDTFVAWNWKANDAGSSNSDGSITSTVSANTTAGFSIVSWTGTGTNPSTVGHGLGTAPSCIILKNRDTAGDWYVGHDEIGWTDRLKFNTTATTAASSTLWNDTAPTSSVFTISSSLNFSGDNTIAYCFAEKTGYSKFGSYTGNGSTDGTFVYTGFKPAFVMIKRTDNARNWVMFDNKRDGFNSDQGQLKANLTDAEDAGSSYTLLDLFSNGFKCTNTGADKNASGGNYIYMAFGQSLVGSNNIPCTAR